MSIDPDNLNVVNNAAASRFEAQLNGDDLAITEYDIAGKNIIFTHTEVPEGYEGQGIAGKVVEVALTWSIENGYKIQALCPYVKKYVDEHPAYQPHTWGYKK